MEGLGSAIGSTPTINGLVLPTAYLTAVQQGAFRRNSGCWRLRHNRDAWDEPLETELCEVFEESGRIEEETKRLTLDFPDDPFDGPDISEDEPGFIPYITDFTKVLCFGVSGEGDPFCFDFRADAQEPEIIWWEDTFWRCVAPDWPSFAALFEIAAPEASLAEGP